MQSLESLLAGGVKQAIGTLYAKEVDLNQVVFQKTNKEFEGDLTLLVFPLAKLTGKHPETAANEIGEYLHRDMPEISGYNVVKGFLNLVISDEYWLRFFESIHAQDNYGTTPETKESPFVMVEYSSPNTNKPLHLGHIRNNLLGYSVSEILKAAGNKVMMVNLVNDRGIHICKSMLAWQKYGNGETPESSGMKGDHLVGKYYVEFDKHYKKEIEALVAHGQSKEDAEKNAPLMQEAQEMLRQWEAGNPDVIALWKKMNGWVYDGFAATYKKLGVHFDKTYYESNTYILGKEIIEQGLKDGILEKPENAPGPVILDLTPNGLDKKVLLRSDGTSVYMTQDLGTAVERHKEFPFDQHIYVVGNEQDYHFKVLKIALRKLGYEWAEGLHHLSYGMVELPEGKMKSREGTVVDADDLIDAVVTSAREMAEEKGLIEGMGEEEKQQLYFNVGMAALKYFILKVDPKKKMLFNPQESVDLQGNTGPFIQYAFARSRQVMQKVGPGALLDKMYTLALHPKDRELIRTVYQFPMVISEAAKTYSPAVVANYTYEVAKTYNSWYHEVPKLIDEKDETMKSFRLTLSWKSGEVIRSAMKLLGISVPDKM